MFGNKLISINKNTFFELKMIALILYTKMNITAYVVKSDVLVLWKILSLPQIPPTIAWSKMQAKMGSRQRKL